MQGIEDLVKKYNIENCDINLDYLFDNNFDTDEIILQLNSECIKTL